MGWRVDESMSFFWGLRGNVWVESEISNAGRGRLSKENEHLEGAPGRETLVQLSRPFSRRGGRTTRSSDSLRCRRKSVSLTSHIRHVLARSAFRYSSRASGKPLTRIALKQRMEPACASGVRRPLPHAFTSEDAGNAKGARHRLRGLANSYIKPATRIGDGT